MFLFIYFSLPMPPSDTENMQKQNIWKKVRRIVKLFCPAVTDEDELVSVFFSQHEVSQGR